MLTAEVETSRRGARVSTLKAHISYSTPGISEVPSAQTAGRWVFYAPSSRFSTRRAAPNQQEKKHQTIPGMYVVYYLGFPTIRRGREDAPPVTPPPLVRAIASAS